MKYIIILLFFLFDHSLIKGQNYITSEGEFMDTTLSPNSKCKEYDIYYYDIGGKYPESSSSLLKELQMVLQKKNETYSGTGYITFRCRVDCDGKKTNKTQVLQIDQKYMPCHFEKKLVNELFSFFKSLDKWETPQFSNNDPVSYIIFITFKIKNGKIINIIP
jgi:hypothetical protein